MFPCTLHGLLYHAARRFDYIGRNIQYEIYKYIMAALLLVYGPRLQGAGSGPIQGMNGQTLRGGQPYLSPLSPYSAFKIKNPAPMPAGDGCRVISIFIVPIGRIRKKI
jgi:hypothetical protein